MPRQQSLQHRLLDGGVREHEAQHGRHVGRDHAGALAEAVDGDLVPPILAIRVASLG